MELFTSSDEVFKAGYALTEYNINSDNECYRFHDEHYTVPANSVFRHTVKLNDYEIDLPKIEDVREHAIKD